uniref:Uncharacterized protein n=1 Tax=Arundo donax TaxID=35708 RepID=A0A0A9BX71_ARUDO
MRYSCHRPQTPAAASDSGLFLLFAPPSSVARQRFNGKKNPETHRKKTKR